MIDDAEVKKIAGLARLQVDAAQAAALKTSLNQILEMVAAINQADTEQVRPMAHPLNMQQRLRADEVTETAIDVARIQELAPETEAGLYLVPQVIE